MTQDTPETQAEERNDRQPALGAQDVEQRLFLIYFVVCVVLLLVHTLVMAFSPDNLQTSVGVEFLTLSLFGLAIVAVRTVLVVLFLLGKRRSPPYAYRHKTPGAYHPRYFMLLVVWGALMVGSTTYFTTLREPAAFLGILAYFLLFLLAGALLRFAWEGLEFLGIQSSSGPWMWVQPNPFFIIRKFFKMMPGQVFVVQDLKLEETVLRPIQKKLSNSGYTFKSAAHRGGHVVFNDVWNTLNESEIVLVDFTNSRPNVYLEFGMALVVGKPTVWITQSTEAVPSDVPHLRYETYKPDEEGLRVLAEKLPDMLDKAIKDFSQGPTDQPADS